MISDNVLVPTECVGTLALLLRDPTRAYGMLRLSAYLSNRGQPIPVVSDGVRQNASVWLIYENDEWFGCRIDPRRSPVTPT